MRFTPALYPLVVASSVVFVASAPASADTAVQATTAADVFLAHGPMGAAVVVLATTTAALFWLSRSERKEAQERADRVAAEHKAEMKEARDARDRERERWEAAQRELTAKVVEGQAKQTAVLGDVATVLNGVMQSMPVLMRVVERIDDSQRIPANRGGR